MKSMILLVSWVFIGAIVLAQPTISLTKTIGGAGVEIIKDLIADSNGNMIALCRIDSLDGDVECTLQGQNDVWLVKTDAAGTILEQSCYGGSDDEEPYQLMQTADGGWLITGTTFSNDGDVAGNHGATDVWVVKLDDAWNIEWQRCIGGTSGDQVHNSVQLQNGKYAINCETLSSNGDFPMHYGGYLSEDAWIVLLNTDGSIDTALIYGGSGDDQISEIIELPDHDWQVFGTTLSTDFDLSSTISLGYRDGWIFKTDSNGIIKWTKRYGSGAPDFLETAKMISKYFFLTAGSTSGFITNHGSADVWVMKIDSSGNVISNYTHGGLNGDVVTNRMRFESVDNGHLSLAAYSYSNDGDVGMNHGYSDYWSIKLDTNGVLLASLVAGGSNYDDTHCNSAGNLTAICLGGLTISDDLDVQEYKGSGDGWLVVISDYNNTSISQAQNTIIDVFPNPSSHELTVCMTGGNLTAAWFELFSLDSRRVLRRKIGKCITFDVEHLPQGLYHYSVTGDNKILSKGKLIIQ